MNTLLYEVMIFTILYLITPLTCQSNQITSIEVISNLNNQQNKKFEILQTKAEKGWESATLSLESIFKTLNETVENISNLYEFNSKQSFLSSMSPYQCKPYSSTQYLTNISSIYDTLCCHIRVLRRPALVYVLSAANIFYHGVSSDSDSGKTSSIIESFSILQNIEKKANIIRSCINNPGIFDSGLSYIKSKAVIEVVSILKKIYSDLIIDSKSMVACFNLQSACNQSIPIIWDNIKPNFLFSYYEESFLKVCNLDHINASFTSGICDPFPYEN
jgi:hypothetical protein